MEQKPKQTQVQAVVVDEERERERRDWWKIMSSRPAMGQRSGEVWGDNGEEVVVSPFPWGGWMMQMQGIVRMVKYAGVTGTVVVENGKEVLVTKTGEKVEMRAGGVGASPTPAPLPGTQVKASVELYSARFHVIQAIWAKGVVERQIDGGVETVTVLGYN